MKGKKTGGRVKGSRNKKLLEREALERIREENLKAGLEALGPKETIATRVARKLAIDELAEMLPVIKGVMAYYQPTPPGARRPDGTPLPENPKGNWAEFKDWAGVFIDACSRLAPFQSPRFSAVMVGASVITRVEVEGGLPDEEDGGLMDAGPLVIDAGDGGHDGSGQPGAVPPGSGPGVPAAGEAQGDPVRTALG